MRWVGNYGISWTRRSQTGDRKPAEPHPTEEASSNPSLPLTLRLWVRKIGAGEFFPATLKFRPCCADKRDGLISESTTMERLLRNESLRNRAGTRPRTFGLGLHGGTVPHGRADRRRSPGRLFRPAAGSAPRRGSQLSPLPAVRRFAAPSFGARGTANRSFKSTTGRRSAGSRARCTTDDRISIVGGGTARARSHQLRRDALPARAILPLGTKRKTASSHSP